MRLPQTRSSSAERAVAGDLELAERRQVDDPDPLAHRCVLDGDAVVGRRPRPAERALLLACAAPRLARAEVVGALPAVLRQPNTAPSSCEPPVQRAEAPRPARLGDVVRDSAAGSSTCRPRARPRRRSRDRDTGRRSATAGRAARRPRPRRSSRARRAPCRARPRRRSRSARDPLRARSRARPASGRAAGCRRASSRRDDRRARSRRRRRGTGTAATAPVHQLLEPRVVGREHA